MTMKLEAQMFVDKIGTNEPQTWIISTRTAKSPNVYKWKAEDLNRYCGYQVASNLLINILNGNVNPYTFSSVDNARIFSFDQTSIQSFDKSECFQLCGLQLANNDSKKEIKKEFTNTETNEIKIKYSLSLNYGPEINSKIIAQIRQKYDVQ